MSKLPSPIAAFDFQIDSKADLDECIETVIRQLKPEKAVAEYAVSFGPKEQGGPVHCFIEFYAESIEEGEEVVTDGMRINGE